jgi:sialate O-acetylesterase
MKKGLATVFVFLILIYPVRAEISLPNLLGDHMVVQREAKVRIWGWSNPGEKVRVEFNGHKALTEGGKEGTWSVWLEPMKAGGPYDLTITGKNTLVVKDVLVGEVWVGAGQSNMWLPVGYAANPEKETAAAKYPQIRLFIVGQKANITPLNDVAGGWAVCSPQTVSSFSATAYYFGRELHTSLNVPVGLIASSWGGTNASTWIPGDVFKSVPELKSFQEYIGISKKDIPAATKRFLVKLDEWEKATHRNDPENIGFREGWAKPEYNDRNWPEIDLPGSFDNLNGKENFDGVAWFRREVVVPSDWAGKDMELSLGAIDDYDTTYFNGTKVGSIGVETLHPYSTPRNYKIPGSLVKAGRNVIAVRAFDNFWMGGFSSPAQEMAVRLAGKKDAAAIGVSGRWRAKIEQEIHPIHRELSKPRDPICAGEVLAPGALYNAMIHPLTPYAIRGVIWYQGEREGCDGNPYDYRALLPGLIRGWRDAWGRGDFPFLYVQLPNYMAVTPDPGESHWAELREAEMMTLKCPNTGMAVTIDIGDAVDIHPKNKQDAGKRLALWALANTYGQKNVVYSGPLYKSMSVEGNKIRVRFTHVDSGLKAKGDKLTGFAVAGKDKKFVWAEAKIEGDSVVVWSDMVSEPAAVRYAWADNPLCNFYNKAGLPACPFRTDK